MQEMITPEEYWKLETAKKPLKYRNKITEIDGIKFHSKKEAKRYQHLCLLLKSRHITEFKRQVKYPLVVNGIKICDYVADFVITWPSGNVTVEDVKGMTLPIFKIKAKLMKACHDIDIKLV